MLVEDGRDSVSYIYDLPKSCLEAPDSVVNIQFLWIHPSAILYSTYNHLFISYKHNLILHVPVPYCVFHTQ
jgi:hypothetical protein